MTRAIMIALVCLVVCAGRAEADCTGSGITWTCASGSTSAQINTALSNATDGATLTFASGTYSMAAHITFSNSKGATLICETVSACDVTLNGFTFGMPLTLSGVVTKSYRISGFDFVDSATYAIEFSVPSSNTGSLSSVRIDHNRFQNIAAGDFTIQFCRPDATANICTIYGLIDHNEFSAGGSFSAFRYSGWETSAVASPLGTANNVFFEDNLAQATQHTSPGIGCLDTEAGSAVVYRFNTFINCMGASHGVLAGGGPNNVEYYGNLYQITSIAVGQEQFQDCTWIFHHQGSNEITYWGNQCTPLSGHTTAAFDVLHYRDGTGAFNTSTTCDGTQTSPADGNRSTTATYRGYPCWRQPGRDNNGVLKPMYSWMNTFTDNGAILPVSISDVGGTPDYNNEHFDANRDYYFAVSASAQSNATTPFNGTTGMGFGTLANRPTTCTKTPEALDEPNGGVGYFATDQGSWNQSTSNPRGVDVAGADGLLYRCSATDTWSLHYTPYTYPHPLQGFVAGGGSPVRIRLRQRIVMNLAPFFVAPMLFGGVYAVRRRVRH